MRPQSWTPAEITVLREHAMKGCTSADIGFMVGRSEGSTQAMRRRLRLPYAKRGARYQGSEFAQIKAASARFHADGCALGVRL